MKMKRLGCLLYRELYLSRKSLLTNGVMALSTMILGILILLSVKHGNLALIPEEYEEGVKELIFVFAAFLPVYACMTFAISLVEGWQFECERKWKLFRKTIPVSGCEYILVKYILLFLAMGFTVPLSYFYMWCSNLIVGTNETEMSIQCVLVILFVFMCFSQGFQIFILLFGSMDRAAIAYLIVFTVSMFLGIEVLIRSDKLLMNTDMMVNDLFACFASFLPQVTGVFLVTTVICFFLSVKLYERREK